MAHLGTIGYSIHAKDFIHRLDIALGWNITNNPIKGFALSGSYTAVPKAEDWKNVAGTVENEAGTRVSRRIHFYQWGKNTLSPLRYLGSVVSAPVTGVFASKIPLITSTEVRAICIGDDTPEADSIHRVLPT